MTELGRTTWYTLPPKNNNLYYGTVKDWTQTLITKINQGGATLYQNRSVIINQEKNDYPVIYRQVVVPNWFKKQFELLEFYNPITFNLAGRYDVEFFDVKNIMVCEKFDNREFFITIELINENHR